MLCKPTSCTLSSSSAAEAGPSHAARHQRGSVAAAVDFAVADSASSAHDVENTADSFCQQTPSSSTEDDEERDGVTGRLRRLPDCLHSAARSAVYRVSTFLNMFDTETRRVCVRVRKAYLLKGSSRFTVELLLLPASGGDLLRPMINSV